MVPCHGPSVGPVGVDSTSGRQDGLENHDHPGDDQRAVGKEGVKFNVTIRFTRFASWQRKWCVV